MLAFHPERRVLKVARCFSAEHLAPQRTLVVGLKGIRKIMSGRGRFGSISSPVLPFYFPPVGSGSTKTPSFPHEKTAKCAPFPFRQPVGHGAVSALGTWLCVSLFRVICLYRAEKPSNCQSKVYLIKPKMASIFYATVFLTTGQNLVY